MSRRGPSTLRVKLYAYAHTSAWGRGIWGELAMGWATGGASQRLG